MQIGYARISTEDQKLDLQRDALVRAGVEPDRIYEDTASGKDANRANLQGLLKTLRSGDTLVVWKLDRLARSMSDLLAIMQQIEAAGANLKSLSESIDTTTLVGRMIFHLLGAFAQFERDLIVERTKEGLKAAAARGRKGGNVRIPKTQQEKIRAMREAGKAVPEIAEKLKLSKATVYRYLKDEAAPTDQGEQL